MTENPANQDWVDALLADVPAFEPNPHYHCNMQDATPCPTGEHTNPFPIEWKPAVGAPASWGMQERPSRTGERCTCGHRAIKVYRNPDGTEVPYCGIPGR